MSPYCPAGRQLGACPAPPFGFCTVPRVLMSVLLCVLGVGASCRAIPPLGGGAAHVRITYPLVRWQNSIDSKSHAIPSGRLLSSVHKRCNFNDAHS